MLPNICPYCFQPINGCGPCLHCGHTTGEPRSGTQQLPLGTILDGKYQLGMVLGQGGFGITYLAYDMTLRMRVAIKEYFPLGLVTRQGQTVTFTGGNAQHFFQKGVEAFYREAQLLARFQMHPNIVHVSSFFRQNGTAYFVMEYVEGESLSAYLDRCGGRLSYDETVRLMTPVLNALEDVHNAGILHRDIAPDNICLAKDGYVKLLDFGAAKNELSLHTHSSAAILKPGYAPLEQYSSGSNQGPWTDIYAIGAVIYKCLIGSVPPDAPDRIVGQQLIPFSEANVIAPVGAEAAINKALALDIQNRWQGVAEFKNALNDPSELKKVQIQTSKPEKSQKPKSQKPWLIPVSVIAVLFIITGVILSQVILSRERIYQEGTSLIAAGKYEDAILKLSGISSYRDSSSQIRRAKSLQAEVFLALNDYKKADALFSELRGKEYASERIAKRKEEYEKLHLVTPEPTIQILSTEMTPEPTPIMNYVQNELQKRLSESNLGDVISFGRYEQDGNEDNGPEDIKWVVIEKKDGKMLLVSRFVIDKKPYHNKNEKITWETSDLRKWLNNDFFNLAFSREEKNEIIETEISTSDFFLSADKWIEEGGRKVSFRHTDVIYYGGNNVYDRVFLLSKDELKKFRDSIFSIGSSTSRESIWIRSGTGNQIQHVFWEGEEYETDLYFSPIYYPPRSEITTVSTDSSRIYGIQPAIWIKTQTDMTDLQQNQG